MDMMVICGSCYTLVEASPSAEACPRCRGALEPTPQVRLEKFIKRGVDTTRKGVPLHQSQEAAAQVLGELTYTKMKLQLHHLGERCSDCEGS